jgi:hypothetical protein
VHDIARSNFIGTFVNSLSGVGIVELMELSFDSEMPSKIESRVEAKALKGLVRIVWTR